MDLRSFPLILLLSWGASSWGSPAGSFSARVPIPAGKFRPFFGITPLQADFPVATFSLDRNLVTFQSFSEFLKAQPEWSKDQVSPLLADRSYLTGFAASLQKSPQAPVTQVSWYAAEGFCRWRKGRLPSTLEWEYVGAASRSQPNAMKDPVFVQEILSWYAQPSAGEADRAVGKKAANFYGVQDLHGYVWEWTSDFNSFFVAPDNRQDGDQSKNLFCGASSTGAANKEDYAAFIRYAMRSSLQADFTQRQVGFRCAYDD